MKILFALHPKSTPQTWQRSGDTNMATRMIPHFPEGVEVDVFTDTSGYNRDNPDEIAEFHDLLDRLNISGVINSAPYIQKRTYLKESMTYIRSIADQYDLIHFHNATVASISWMTKMFEDCETPLVYTMHTPPDVGASFQHYHGDDYINFAKVRRNRLVAVSPTHYDRTLSALKSTPEDMPYLQYITNGIETDDMRGVDSLGMFDIAVIGRLDPSKDILHSLKAARTATEGPIIYIGDTTNTSVKNQEYYDEVVKFVEENRILWVKSMTNAQVRATLASSKVHIALSRIETYGLTVAESMMQGTPVIGFDNGGIGDLIIDGVTGVKLFTDRKKWTTRYLTIAEKYQEALKLDRDNVREQTRIRYNIEGCVAHYFTLYNEMIGGNK